MNNRLKVSIYETTFYSHNQSDRAMVQMDSYGTVTFELKQAVF